jgi:hypothetical protein
MGVVLSFPGHALTSATSGVKGGLGIASGQGVSGQLSENHCKVRSSRLTWMSAPRSIAGSFLVSPVDRQLTVDKSNRVASAYARATASKWSMPDMQGISVILPNKSTVFLQRAVSVNSGYITGMELKEIVAWVDERKAAKGIRSDLEVERGSGAKWAVQNMRKGLKTGKFVPKVGTLEKLANFLGEPPARLFQPVRAPHKPPQSEFQRLVAERDACRQKALEFTQRADSIEIAIKILERPTG